MSEDFVRAVLREHAEAGMPAGKDPWPAIKQRVQAASPEHRAATLPAPIIPAPVRRRVEASQSDRRMDAYTGARRFRLNMATAMVGLLALATGSIALLTWNGLHPVSVNTPVPGCWGIVPSPNVEGGDTVLSALSASSADDVWAVGYSTGGGVPQTLVQRWGGQRWSIVPSANVESRSNYLTGVAALAPDNIWAVGYHCTGNCDADVAPLVQHWDGAQWSIASTPGNGRLSGIAAVSANDMWAVGNDGHETLALHWDGSRWTRVPTNDPLLPNSFLALNAVVAISSNDVWAVGQEHDTVGNKYKNLIYHWDGLRWASSPESGAALGVRLYGVAATSARDVWAVGEKDNSPSTEEPLETATMHWDGANWSNIPSPNVGTGGSYLRGVEAVSPSDAWALGGYGPLTGTKQTLVLHWDGTSWSVVPSPNVEGQSNRFFSVNAISANEIWAVGTYNLTGTGAFVQRYNNPCTTANTANPTELALVPASAQAPSPIPCTSGSFSDVLPGSAFHPFVRCLVQQGTTGGYDDCTFRPDNEVTRGQLSKIVSNSAGFKEDPGAQRFEDVPPTDTYYGPIQRLAARKLVGGYECGGPGESCTSGKPYFRPNAVATRGQIARIVSIAMGFSDAPGAQIFEDVSPTSTFYEGVQRLASRNIMGGYACGGAGEQCLSGKPYFRPNNAATRGQVSKIVANAFFPNCEAGNKP